MRNPNCMKITYSSSAVLCLHTHTHTQSTCADASSQRPISCLHLSIIEVICLECIKCFNVEATRTCSVGFVASDCVCVCFRYLEVEWEVRKGTQRSFGKDVMKGSSPRVPQQDNFSDCGVYILQYVESFFEVRAL